MSVDSEATRGVYVIGAGGHAKVVIATLRAAGDTIEAVVDDDTTRHGDTVLGELVRGGIEEIPQGARAIVAVGDNASRQRLVLRAGEVEWIRAVHPDASIDPSATIEPGAAVFAGAVVQADATVGAHAIVNTAASVDHDSHVGAYAHIAPGARLAGAVRVGEGALVGVGATVTPEKSVGSWSTLGAGAVAISDVPPDVVAVGVPAKARTRSREGET